MTIEIAKRLGRALNVRSGTRIQQIDEALRAYGRAVAQGPTVPMTGSIDASQVISGTMGDARVAQSNVTQHEAALNIDYLQLTGVTVNLAAEAEGSALGNYANDAAAAGGGVAVGQFYRFGSIVMVRVV